MSSDDSSHSKYLSNIECLEAKPLPRKCAVYRGGRLIALVKTKEWQRKLGAVPLRKTKRGMALPLALWRGLELGLFEIRLKSNKEN